MRERSMKHIESLQEQIRKTEIVLAESQENFEKNPKSYSARFLLMSTENHLADLLRLREALEDGKKSLTDSSPIAEVGGSNQ